MTFRLQPTTYYWESRFPKTRLNCKYSGGRGKDADIHQLCQEVRERWNFIYMPIRLRFNYEYNDIPRFGATDNVNIRISLRKLTLSKYVLGSSSGGMFAFVPVAFATFPGAAITFRKQSSHITDCVCERFRAWLEKTAVWSLSTGYAVESWASKWIEWSFSGSERMLE